MKVLVTGAGALLGQGIIRSLLQGELRPDIVAVDPSALAAGLYWTPRRYLVPMATDPAYLDELGRVVRHERPDAVLVGTDVELGILSRERFSLEAEWRTKVIVSDPQVIAIADDKFKTYEFLGSNGFRVPFSCLPGSESELIRRVGFPLVVKPRVGARAVGLHVVSTEDELRQAIANVHQPVIQECVGDASHEFTAGVIVFDRVAEASIVMRRDLRDGNTYRAYVDEFPELNQQVRRMGEALNAFGPVNFQFRLDADGRAVVFEINARFSGTTPLRRIAGFPEVDMVLRRVLLGHPIDQPIARPMTLVRHWEETIIAQDMMPPSRPTSGEPAS